MADAEALALVAGAAFLEAFAGILDGADIVAHLAKTSSADAFRRYIGDGAITGLAEAERGAAPLGYTLLTPVDLPIEAQADDIELKRIYTLASVYGSGVGAALMAQAVGDARAAGHRRMLLGVYGGNARAHRFYEKSGFTHIGARRFLVGETWHDDRVYALPL